MPSRAVPPSRPRAAPRHKVFLPAEMAAAGATCRVHLLNLSPTGALIHADAAPEAGTVVQLTCAQASWAVRVVWAHDKRFGVVHVPPLAPAAVAALVGKGAA